MNIDEINAMSEEELEEVQSKWTDDDWWAYYTKDGIMTLDEFCEYTIELAKKKGREKYGSAFR